MIGYAAARDLARSLDLHPPLDLAPVLATLGLETVDWRFRGRLREVVMERVIGVDMRLPEPWVRWLTAHGVGHHLLHTGTSFYLGSWQWVNRVKAERQAGGVRRRSSYAVFTRTVDPEPRTGGPADGDTRVQGGVGFGKPSPGRALDPRARPQQLKGAGAAKPTPEC